MGKRTASIVRRITSLVLCAAMIFTNLTIADAGGETTLIQNAMYGSVTTDANDVSDSGNGSKAYVEVRLYVDGVQSSAVAVAAKYFNANQTTPTITTTTFKLATVSPYTIQGVYYHTASSKTSVAAVSYAKNTDQTNLVIPDANSEVKISLKSSQTGYNKGRRYIKNYLDVYLEAGQTTAVFAGNLLDYDLNTVNKSAMLDTLNRAVAILDEESVESVESVESEKSKEKEKISKILREIGTMLFTNGGNVPFVETEEVGKVGKMDSDSVKKKLFPYNRNNTNGNAEVRKVYHRLTSATLTDGLIQFNVGAANLFGTENNSDAKEIFTNVEIPFVLEDGYYVLDSSKYNYTYNRDTNALDKTDVTQNMNFLPLGSENFGFGMQVDLAFTMNDQGTTDGTETGTPAIFEFSGDDDVWVYVDGKIALDLGGIHGSVSGRIDFKNQRVVYDYEVVNAAENALETDPDTGETYISFETLGLSVNDNKAHTLSVFYLERGASVSNCKIKFNMPTINEEKKTDVSFLKADLTSKDSETKKLVEGAEFTLYTDEGCTKEAGHVAASDESGVVTFYDVAGGIYYMKETITPEGYDDNTTVYTVTVTINADSGASVVNIVGDGSTGNGSIEKIDDSYVIYNHKIVVQYDLKTNKTTTVVNWDDRTYEINLSAWHETTMTKVVDVALVLDVSASMTWMLEQPTGEQSTVGSLAKTSQNLAKGNWDYTYYVEDGGEYKPIDYVRNGTSGTGWYIVEARGSNSGDKVVGDKIYSTKVSNSTVVYKKGANDKTKLEALTDSVKSFVELLKLMSPDSKVAITYFASDVNHGVLQTLTEAKNVDVDALNLSSKVSGGTRQDLGLGDAYTELVKSDNKNQYTILFTDGAPNPVSTDIYKSEGLSKVKNISTVYAIGLYNSETANTKITNDGNSSVAVEDALKTWATAESNAYNISDTELIETAFRAILGSISEAAEDVQIKDIVDSRFSITDENGVILTDGIYYIKMNGEIITEEPEGEYGIVRVVGGNGIVTYEDQTVSFGNAENPGWTGKIYIKAKTNYLGGNNVETNDEGSGLTYDSKTISFAKPKVNVKIAASITNAADTIFKGETLAAYYDGTVTSLTDIVSSYAAENEILDTQDVTIQVEWYSDEAYENKITDVSTITNAAPVSETVYYARVIITPAEAEEESTANTAKNANEVSIILDGTYTVSVVDGTLKITKTIDTAAYVAGEGDPIFTFRITNETTGTVYYKTLRFTDVTTGTQTATRTTTLTGLPQGIYKVEELATVGFKTSAIETVVADTNCTSTIDGLLASYYAIGIDMDVEGNSFDNPEQVVSGRTDEHLEKDKAATNFTNAKNRSPGKLTDTDAHKNSLVIGQTITNDSTNKEVDNDHTGTY